MLPRAILFDLDDTIISYKPRRPMIAEVADEFAAHVAPAVRAHMVSVIDTEYDAFWSDPLRNKNWHVRAREARRSIFAAALAKFPDCPLDLVHRMADRFNQRRETEMFFFPGALETIEELNRRGVRMALVTNGAREVQRIKIDMFDLARRFHHVQVEEEAGFGKPDERAYAHALKMVDAAPHETWMIGDHLENDVAAPMRAGIHGIWHDHRGEGLPADCAVKPDRIVTSIRELLQDLD